MISIIPQPLKIEKKNELFIFPDKIAISGDFDSNKKILAAMLEKCGIATSLKDGGAIVFAHNASMEEEEYCLTITQDSIKIDASTEKGCFYAIQSLRQASKLDTLSKGEKVIVDACIISDKPRFKYRSFMLDIARHFYDKEVIKQYLDIMALTKMNIFHWHLTDDQGWRVEIKKYPLLTQKGTTRSSTTTSPMNNGEKRINEPYGEGKFFTQADIKEIVKYAQDLHIDIVPEIDMPGHMTAAIACYPELACEGTPIDVCNSWGVMDTIGCAGGGKFMEFVKDILTEICPLFPYEYFHIGGDEVPKTKWKACPKCQAKMKELNIKNENDLQGWFNTQITEFLATKNKKVVGWNEILEASELPDQTLIQWWTGGAKSTGVDKWVKKGNKIIISYCPSVYMDHLYSMKDLKKSYLMDLDTLGLDAKFENQVLGMESPMWTEYVRNVGKLQFNSYPRLQAIAECGWTAKQNKNFANFEVRLKDFEKILDKFNIVHAPRKYYWCRGLSNIGRIVASPKNWLTNPDCEYEKWQKDKTRV